MLYDPYALLDFWPEFSSEAALPIVSNDRLFVIDRSLYYELLPMHSTDDGRAGYPGDSHSYSDYSSDSLPSLPAGIEPGGCCRPPVGRWLAPRRIPQTRSIEVQTNRLSVQEDGVGTEHGGYNGNISVVKSIVILGPSVALCAWLMREGSPTGLI